MVPFALEMWLGHDTVIFTGKPSFGLANEKCEEKGNDDEDYREADEWCKPTQ